MDKHEPSDSFGLDSPEEVRIKNSGQRLMALGDRMEALKSEWRLARAEARSKGLPVPPMPTEYAEVEAEFNRVADSHPG